MSTVTQTERQYHYLLIYSIINRKGKLKKDIFNLKNVRAHIRLREVVQELFESEGVISGNGEPSTQLFA